MGLAMSISRAGGAMFAFVLVAASTLLSSPVALAQEPVVVMTLQAQTPFTTVEEPVGTIKFVAENLGDTALEDLSVGLSIGSAIRSRGTFVSSLVEGPGETPISVVARSQTGALEPGVAREFSASVDMSELDEVSKIDSAIYPARVDLRAGGIRVGYVDTPLINLVRTPDVPIDFAWWVELDAPVAMDPQGLLIDPAFESAIAPGGGLGQQIQALESSVAPDDGVATVNLVIVPAVIDQLARMADGYARSAGDPVPADERPASDAAALLAKLRDLVEDPDVHVVVAPFSAPLLPSLASGGLAGDVDRQQDLGEAIVAEHLGLDPIAMTARPPQGALDGASLQWIADRGSTTVLAQADTVDRPTQPNDFAPLPTATVATDQGAVLSLVLPDPGLQALLSDPLLLSDPVRASQAMLGELAAVWREQPVPGPQLDGTETVRGIALALPATLPAEMWLPLVRRLTKAPFLRRTDAVSFTEHVHPVTEDAEITQSLARFPRDYVDDIREQRRNVAAYRSMLVGSSTQPDKLERNLLYAEAAQFVSDPLAGRAWYDQVTAATDAIFEAVLPDVEQEFLLTSSEGSIPLRMGDPGLTPLTVQVVMRSASFEFPQGAEQTVRLEGPNEIVQFGVVAKATGPQTIKVKIRAPSGRDLGEDQNLTVRTTAVNAVALWTTIWAAAVLLLLWSRRLVRRPRP
jgi:hypothetical protein